jgi:uncharacterized ParB-like nuclease family protein
VKELKQIPIDDIRIDGGTQLRAAIDQATVDDYAERIDELPPSIVFNDGAANWLADGFHRLHGHNKAGKKKMLCEVRKGTQRDAILYALGANAAHGLRRSNADKREAVEAALADSEWSSLSDRKIAEMCGVSADFVGNVRRICNPITDAPRPSCDQSHDAPATRTVERSGKTYTMNVRRIAESKRKNGKSENGNGKHAEPEDEVEIIPSIDAPTNGKHPAKEAPAGPVKDEEGQEIKPQKLVELWSRRQEITDLMTAVTKIKSTVNRACDAKDPLYTHVSVNQLIADCGNVYRALRFARPYAVCPYCGGRTCKVCKTGFVGETQFKNYTPEDLKV